MRKSSPPFFCISRAQDTRRSANATLQARRHASAGAMHECDATTPVQLIVLSFLGRASAAAFDHHRDLVRNMGYAHTAQTLNTSRNGSPCFDKRCSCGAVYLHCSISGGHANRPLYSCIRATAISNDTKSSGPCQRLFPPSNVHITRSHRPGVTTCPT